MRIQNLSSESESEQVQFSPNFDVLHHFRSSSGRFEKIPARFRVTSGPVRVSDSAIRFSLKSYSSMINYTSILRVLQKWENCSRTDGRTHTESDRIVCITLLPPDGGSKTDTFYRSPGLAPAQVVRLGCKDRHSTRIDEL